MLAKTHIAFGFLLALIIQNLIETGNEIIFFLLVIIGSLLPDIDSSHSKISNRTPLIPGIISIFSKHRGIFHSLFFAFLIPGLIWYFLSPIYGAALFIGYLSHLLADAFTDSGINFLNPITKFKIEGPITTGALAERFIFFILIALILIELI